MIRSVSILVDRIFQRSQDHSLLKSSIFEGTVLHSYSSGPELVRDFVRDVPDCYFSFQYSDLMSEDEAVKERYRKTGESSENNAEMIKSPKPSAP